MFDLRDLYQEVIRDHSKQPRNCHALEDATRKAEGFNPFCGDRVTVYLKIEDDVVQDISFQGTGCAISTASASMMTESLKGKSREEVEHLFERFHDLITGPPDEIPDTEGLGKLKVFAGVREFPLRVKCASLAWHTLRAALRGEAEPVTTE